MTEDERLLELNRMKFRATALFVAVTIIFIIASFFYQQYPWVGFIRAFAEAAMIGALADWFAVTALFRHPLGIPIPHTAIIPARKDRIADSFGRFVTNNFLDPDKIVVRLRGQDVTGRLAHWLSRPDRSAMVADAAAELLAGTLQVVDDADVNAMIERGLVDRVRALPVTPALGKALGSFADDERQRRVFYGLVQVLSRWFEENQGTIRSRIAGELPRWLAPFNLEQRIYEKMFEVVNKTISELKANPDHPLYKQFAASVDKFIVDLQEAPELRERGEALKEELLAHPIVREAAASVWLDLKAALLRQTADPTSALHISIQQGLLRLGTALENDPTWRAKVDGWVEAVARFIVRRYGPTLGSFMAQTIRDWDAEATSRRIELQIGRDLQYIRINGTIVGGLAGLVIYSIAQLF
jgi:uncharacterized membrane-anchored protein YjiN (DUF445 family)